MVIRFSNFKALQYLNFGVFLQGIQGTPGEKVSLQDNSDNKGFDKYLNRAIVGKKVNEVDQDEKVTKEFEASMVLMQIL